jgi:hypothetical protein
MGGTNWKRLTVIKGTMSHAKTLFSTEIFCLQAWDLAGAHKHGENSWIAVMYGYTFAAAKHNMWHHVDHTTIALPSLSQFRSGPKLLHLCNGGSVQLASGHVFSFDKRRHMGFKFGQCPPWNDLNSTSTGGIFQHPPSVKELVASRVGHLALECNILLLDALSLPICPRHYVAVFLVVDDCREVPYICSEVDVQYQNTAVLPSTHHNT